MTRHEYEQKRKKGRGWAQNKEMNPTTRKGLSIEIKRQLKPFKRVFSRWFNSIVYQLGQNRRIYA